jgi:predicted RNA-binding protein YlxR (DUF448 family)
MMKLPVRRCIGCRESFDKKSLIRIVKEPEGTISIDLTGKKNGRGAYICKNKKCLEMAFKKKQLDYSFKEKVSAETYEKLKEELEGYAEG